MKVTLLIAFLMFGLLVTPCWGLVVVDDDFEDYSDGSSIAGQKGWTGPAFQAEYGTPDTPGPVIVNSPVSGGSRAARWQCMPGTDVRSATMTNFFPAEWTNGRAVMYIDIAMDATDGPSDTKYGNFSYFQIFDSMGVEATRIYLRRNIGQTGDIHLLGRSSPSDPNPWLPIVVTNPINNVYYKLKLDIDITNKKYDCYVGDGDRSGVNEGHWGHMDAEGNLELDGIPAAENIYFFYPATGLAKVTWLMYRYGSNFSGPSYAYCDNLYIEGPDDAVMYTEVWVARGTYIEQVTLPDYAHLYGGFAGTETSKADRTGPDNVTVIDAGNSAVGVSAVKGGAAAIVDGFTITGGYYGVDCAESSVGITNNVIIGNAQAGVYCDSNAAKVINNTVLANNYGIQCSTGSALISNNIISYNDTGIYSPSANPSLAHNNVYGNTTNYGGIASGLSDMSVDPMFIAPQSGDYRLEFGSPCIDAGNPSTVPQFDNAGGQRPVDGDGDGTPRVDIGAFESQFVPELLSVTDARSRPNDSILRFEEAIVTAAWPGSFYIQADNRASGIRVDKPGHPLSEDVRANVSGRIKTDEQGEMYVDAVAAVENGSGSAEPVTMNIRTLGGAAFGLQQAVGTGIGLNNVGLLVRTMGAVVDMETTGPVKWIRIDDGSGAPARVVVPGAVHIDPAWRYVLIVGINSIEKVGGTLHPLLRVRSQADITPLD